MKKVKSDQSCVGHKCESCDRTLHTWTPLGNFFAVIVPMTIVTIVLISLSFYMDRSLYEPRCWEEHDLKGARWEPGNPVSKDAVMHFPFDCDEFKP